MNILCYGKSEARQRARCEFFAGAGCVANWSTNLNDALGLLRRTRHDAVVLGPTVPILERECIQSTIRVFSPTTCLFTLPAGASEPEDSDVSHLASDLAAILASLNSFHGARSAN